MDTNEMKQDIEKITKEIQEHEQKRNQHVAMAEQEGKQSIAKQGIIQYLQQQLQKPVVEKKNEVKSEVPQIKEVDDLHSKQKDEAKPNNK